MRQCEGISRQATTRSLRQQANDAPPGFSSPWPSSSPRPATCCSDTRCAGWSSLRSAGRILLGLILAVLAPTSSVLQVGRVIQAIGTAIGPTASGMIVSESSWHWIFACKSPVVVVVKSRSNFHHQGANGRAPSARRSMLCRPLGIRVRRPGLRDVFIGQCGREFQHCAHQRCGRSGGAGIVHWPPDPPDPKRL